MRTVKNKGGGGDPVSGKGELDQGKGENKVVVGKSKGKRERIGLVTGCIGRMIVRRIRETG